MVNGIIIKNPQNTKNPSEETVKKHTFVCMCCSCVFISLNSLVDKYCSRECASKHRKELGWKPSEETKKKMSEANKGRVVSEETRIKLRKNISKEDLVRIYIDDNRTQKECAEILGCGPSTITRYLKKYELLGIKSNQDVQLTKSSNTGLYSDKDWLYQKYFVEKKTIEEIADICNAGKTTIKRWIKKHGYEARDRSACRIGKKRRLESCARQSLTMSTKFDSIGWGPGKFYLFRDVVYCGTWEFETARFFYRKNIKYCSHGEFSALKYIDNGRVRHYTPDFYLPSENKYIEIKGRYTKKAKRKMELVINQNDINLEIWFAKDLLELGILSKGYQHLIKEGYYEEFLIKK